MLRLRCSLVTAVALFVCAAPATASVSPPERSARAALDNARQALSGATGTRSATPALAELRARLDDLSGADRAAAASLLARPTDPGTDTPDDVHYNGPSDRFCSTNFCVHFVTDPGNRHAPDLTDADGSGVPDYVELTSRYAEQSYAFQTGRLRWNAIVPDGNAGGDPRSDIYLAELNLFGYATTDDGGVRTAGHLVLDDDYKERDQFSGLLPEVALRTTISHEFNHVLQFTYGVNFESWAFESIASWMELKEFPGDNSPIGLAEFAQETERPLTEGDPSTTTKIYGSYIWNFFLDHRFGPETIRGVWELGRAAQENPAEAYDASIRREGGRGFERQFNLFSAAVAEYRSRNAGFQPELGAVSPAPDIERLGTLRAGGSRSGQLDHATFRLFRVSGARGRRATLTAQLAPGVSGAVALVGLRGNPVGGEITVRIVQRPRGGRAQVAIANPRRFSRLTAVVVNSSIESSGFNSRAGDYNWDDDDARFRVVLSR